jgi:hypothetical protein
MCKQDLEAARQKYMPKPVKYLLIAEAPPKCGSGRFFYFEDVKQHDSLFLETMKVLYTADCLSAKEVRRRKPELLARLKNDGIYLVDASDSPMDDMSDAQRLKYLKGSVILLVAKLEGLVLQGIISKDTPIILIKATVYQACKDILSRAGFKVLNENCIPFPIGHQEEFRHKLYELLKKTGYDFKRCKNE